jgi:hypothetical protein
MTKEELENLTYKELLDYSEKCGRQIEEMKHIIEELEYRLQKLNIKTEVKIQDNPYKIEKIKFIKKTIPEFSYVEYEKVGE